jgi:hypothetical protein
VPKRTNKEQQIIEILKAILAADGVTVTPSKLLHDRQIGIDREVDVVAEAQVDGHTFTQSFEVVARSRPLDISWVEGMLQKHAHLPTDRLYLVSWSGFTKTATRLAETRPAVILATVRRTGGEVTLFADQVNMTLRRATLHARLPDGHIVRVRGAPDTTIHTATGAVSGTLWSLGTWLMNRPMIGQALLDQAHNHSRRDEMKWVEATLPLDRPPVDELYLRHEETSDLHKIVGVELGCDFEFTQQRVDLTVREFAKDLFGHGDVVLGGKPHIVVATVAPDGTVDKVRTDVDKTAGLDTGRQPDDDRE